MKKNVNEHREGDRHFEIPKSGPLYIWLQKSAKYFDSYHLRNAKPINFQGYGMKISQV